jgi:hypothetical protein
MPTALHETQIEIQFTEKRIIVQNTWYITLPVYSILWYDTYFTKYKEK